MAGLIYSHLMTCCVRFSCLHYRMRRFYVGVLVISPANVSIENFTGVNNLVRICCLVVTFGVCLDQYFQKDILTTMDCLDSS